MPKEDKNKKNRRPALFDFPVYFAYAVVGTNIILALTLLLAVVFYPLPILYAQTDGLTGWWSLDGNANDQVGSADGTVSGATLTTGHDGTANGAYSFNGTSDSIDLGTSNFGIDQTNEFTISLWVNRTGNSPVSFYDSIIGRSTYFYPFGIQAAAGTLRVAVRSSGSGAQYIEQGSLTLNTWRHVAVTYASGQAVVYLDGSSVGTKAMTGNPSLSSGDVTL